MDDPLPSSLCSGNILYVAGLRFPAEVESEVETTDKDKAIMEQLAAKIAEAKRKLSKDGGEVVFEKYTMLGDYVDKDTRVSLRRGEVVEVMDAESPHGWLVRKHEDKSKVRLHFGLLFCFLCKRKLLLTLRALPVTLRH